MRLAARLALNTPPIGTAHVGATGPASKSLSAFHGCDVLVRAITEAGFTADIDATIPFGSVVRLRLPGAGTMVARVSDSRSGRVSADFTNPVSPARLRMTLGMGRTTAP
jgi:hypothetical protein